MKKYLFFRIIRSLVSIFLVTTLTYIIIYSLVPRRDVFKDDTMVQKLKSEPDKLTDYENNAFSKMNYIEYLDTKTLLAKASKDGKEVTAAHTAENKKLLESWAKKNGFALKRYRISKDYYVTRELPIWERLGRFYGNLIQVDNPWAVHDPKNPNMKRYVRFENDKLAGFALVGSGTKFKYQIYFNSSFPWIHQNIIHINLGTSYPTFAGLPVSQVMGSRQGQTVSEKFTFPDGRTLNTSDNIYTRQYQPTANQDDDAKERYGDHYTATDQIQSDPSMIGTSFKAGFFALIITYVISIPMAIVMARFKGRFFDRLGTGIVTVLISVPSLAFIYAFRYAGSALFGLPDSFPTLGAGNVNSWVLPTFVLGFLSVSGLVIWFRRYMIDQQSSDYVKFAKAKGLEEGEIYSKHIFKNASIPIVQGIPGQIIGLIGGATITETIFAMPGMGKMLPDSIIAHNNPLVISIVFIFTTIAVFSVLLGDILMTIVDPRIKLSTSGDD